MSIRPNFYFSELPFVIIFILDKRKIKIGADANLKKLK